MWTTSSAECFEPPEFCSGEILAGKYELLEPLAVGGMGRVWVARNLTTGAEVAAKVLLPAHAGSPDGLARFRREAQATAALSHRAIVRVFDLIELDPARGSLVMLMELLRGHSLAHEIAHMGALSVEDTLEIVFPLLSALAHAHGLGIVHRDLKPDNVFLAIEPDGQRMPKIVDFGISKLLRETPITLDGQIVGTLRYMSPEQTMGTAVDARTDIFSAGILLYECLSGKNPFASQIRGDSVLHDLMSVFQVEPRPLSGIPEALWQVIRRALATRTIDRFATAADLADALRRAVPGSPAASVRRTSSGPPPPSVTPVRPEAPLRLSRRILAGALLGSMGVITVASVGRTATSQGSRSGHRFDESSLVSHDKRMAAGVDVFPAAADAAVDTAEIPARSGLKPRASSTARGVRRPIIRRLPGIVRDPGF